ncbi:MAG TPA: hypothetical protein VHQ94_23915, partial [Pyrinomonadaceae bacterium]|nr:hypothetical protein [Pyrinomonadaceae bacterium]
MFKRLAALMLVWALVLSLFSIPVVAQNGTGELVSRIRKEATERSQIMKTMHMFTDVYGPRLTGSPNHKAAAEWAVKQMTAWGLENAHLEPWDFKHPGWANERLSAHLISPVKDPLVCEALAWTPSTKGTVTADAVHLILPERPSQEQLTAFFASNKANVRDRVVLIGKPAVLGVNLNPPAKRQTDEQAAQRYGLNPRPFPFPTASPTPTPAPNAPRPLTGRQVD